MDVEINPEAELGITLPATILHICSEPNPPVVLLI